jgi:hypothetical protein
VQFDCLTESKLLPERCLDKPLRVSVKTRYSAPFGLHATRFLGLQVDGPTYL